MYVHKFGSRFGFVMSQRSETSTQPKSNKKEKYIPGHECIHIVEPVEYDVETGDKEDEEGKFSAQHSEFIFSPQRDLFGAEQKVPQYVLHEKCLINSVRV